MRTPLAELLDAAPDLLLPVDHVELDIPDDVFAPAPAGPETFGWSASEIADYDAPVESPEDEMERARRLPLTLTRSKR